LFVTLLLGDAVAVEVFVVESEDDPG